MQVHLSTNMGWLATPLLSLPKVPGRRQVLLQMLDMAWLALLHTGSAGLKVWTALVTVCKPVLSLFLPFND